MHVIQNIYDRLKDKDRLFWALHCSGWLLYWLFIIIMHASKDIQFTEFLFWTSLTVCTGFFLSLGMRVIYKRLYEQEKSIVQVLFIVLAVTMVTANIWYVLDQLQEVFTDADTIFSIANYLTFTFYWEMLLFTWSALYFVIKFWMDWDEQRSRSEKADVLAKKSQLQMLRYQLNPHFLFNSLNSVRALIDEDADNAKSMITELSEFLRYSLIGKQHIDIPLNYEIEALRHYFAIEKRRYENKLDVSFRIDPLAEDYPVISFLIHPLAENAIKYGMHTGALPLKIRISARVLHGDLIVEVCNSGRWMDPSRNKNKEVKGTGTGLDNVRQRLENAFPGRHRFRIQKESDRVCVRLEIQDQLKTKNVK